MRIKWSLLAKGFARSMLLGGSILLAGCNSGDCYDNKSALPYAGLYESGNSKLVTLNGLTVYGVGAPGDSILYEFATVKQVYLPFRIDSDETTFVFRYDWLMPDSEGSEDSGTGEVEKVADSEIPSDRITFKYIRKPWFADAACGAMYNFEILDISWTSLAIDSVVAISPLITNANTENIRIYFHPQEEENEQ